jgi:endonuclease/exonuclease/phosphatase family metal-dependent hydrolase
MHLSATVGRRTDTARNLGRRGVSGDDGIVRVPDAHRRAAGCLLGLMLAGCAAKTAPPDVSAAPVLLAAVTWNLHERSGDLTRLLDDLEAGRLTGIAVRDYVVLLQEAVVGGVRRQPDVETIARGRNLHVFHVPVFSGDDPARGTAILSTLPLDETRAIDLPQERQHRVSAAATNTVAGQRLFVVSVHLENRLAVLRGGPFGDRARGRQAEALISELPPVAPGIVGGDMNTMLGPGEPAWRVLAKRFDDTPADRSRPTFRDRLVLDHLFFDLPDGWTVTRRVVPERYGSDHHPVIGLVTGTATGG